MKRLDLTLKLDWKDSKGFADISSSNLNDCEPTNKPHLTK